MTSPEVLVVLGISEENRTRSYQVEINSDRAIRGSEQLVGLVAVRLPDNIVSIERERPKRQLNGAAMRQ